MKHQILQILRSEGRASSPEIARRLDLNEEDVRRTISELEKDKTILGYQAVVNPEKIDEEGCLGIIEVKVKPQRAQGYDAIAAQIYGFPEVKLCYLVSGAYDLLVFVEGESL